MKFRWIADPPDDFRGRAWPIERWYLTDEDREEFGAIGEQLERGDGEIDATMNRFHDLVVGRARRTTDDVFGRLPAAELFASDNGGAGADPSAAPDIAIALGLPVPNVRASAGSELPGTDDRVERVLRLADARGSGATLRSFVSRVRRLPLQVRGYQFTVTITPPKTKSVALISMGPHERARGLVTTWVAPGAFAEYFPAVARERFEQELSGVRGELLDQGAVEALADRLEGVLKGESPTVR